MTGVKSYSRSFLLFLFGQGLSNLGDSFRFVAVTVLLYKLTGSGVAAALGLLFSIVPSLLLSPFAGAAGDILDEKYLLAGIDLIRAAVVLLFLFRSDLTGIYLILVLLSAIDTIYSPSRKKFILRLAGKNGVLGANSLLTGISGAAYLAGPLMAGFLTDAYGPSPAFLVNSAACIMSAAATLLVKAKALPHCKSAGRSIIREIAAGFSYCKRNQKVREIIGAIIVTGFSTIAVNMAFYPFAFDSLAVTAKGWSLMITVYYGTNLMALPVIRLLSGRGGRPDFRLFYAGLFLTGMIWFVYTFIHSFIIVLLLQFIEGTVLAVCGILFSSRMQLVSDSGYLARVAGVGDILSGWAKLCAMGCTLLIMQASSFRLVFLINAVLLLLFSFYRLSGRVDKIGIVPD